MRNYLVINNVVNSKDYGVYISGQGTFSAPARAFNMIPIPGRNGALIGYEDRFENIEVTYPAFIVSNFKQNIDDFRAQLLAFHSYFSLWDSYNPNFYREAIFKGPFEPEVNLQNNAGKFNLVFNCKPQRFLVSSPLITVTSSMTINNPTKFTSKPLLTVYGSGTLYIGNWDAYTMNIISTDEYTEIDCETMDCSYGGNSRNQNVAFSGSKFPVFNPGNNYVSFSGGITKVVIDPRWWTI